MPCFCCPLLQVYLLYILVQGTILLRLDFTLLPDRKKNNGWCIGKSIKIKLYRNYNIDLVVSFFINHQKRLSTHMIRKMFFKFEF